MEEPHNTYLAGNNISDDDDDDLSPKCIICHESDTLMTLTHACGEWYIHDNCLTEWFNMHPNECFICRKKYCNIDSKLVNNIGADLSYLLVNNTDIINNRNNRRIDRLYIVFHCIPLLCCAVIINIMFIIISIAYNFLFIARPLNRTYI